MKDPRIDIPQQFKLLPHEALVNVWWTGTLMKRYARRFFRSMAISEAEFNLLLVLRHTTTELNQNDLSLSLLVDKSNITGLIDRLVKAGLIRRVADPRDRRRYNIELLTAGRDRIDEISPAYDEMIRKVMQAFSDQECKKLIHASRKLRQGLVAVEDAAGN